MPLLDLGDIKIACRDLTGIFKLAFYVMLIPLAFTAYYTTTRTPAILVEKSLAFILPSMVFLVLHRLFKIFFTTKRQTQTKQALISVTIAWLIVALVGSLPFMIRGTLGPVDSFFESMSGWATTGMTMIEYPELLRGGNEDILFYRSLTHIVGGVGIIALGLMILIHSGTAAMAYYSSEVGSQKIKPGIKNTVIETWKIYLLYALAGIVLFYLAGMSPFDAINHSFAAIATGGFSTHSESIAYFQSFWIELVAVFLMIMGAVSFIVHYRFFVGDYRYFLKNIETKYMFTLIGISTAAIALFFMLSANIVGVDNSSVFDVIWKSVFQVVSSITCTGFSTVNAGEWPHFAQTILMVLMYTGGFYGSTAGGIKLLRLAVVVKAIHYTLMKMSLPKSAIVSLKVSEKTIDDQEILYVLGLSMAYLMVAIVGASVLMALGYEGFDSMSISLSAMGNVGLVYVTGAPWYHMPAVGKLTITFLMWIGRLEIFPILLLLEPVFRRRR
ncbi:MAG: TrkH family potassium uptake protein [Candidatus Altiarchaeota archaeon]